jgi:hypothetical protein
LSRPSSNDTTASKAASQTKTVSIVVPVVVIAVCIGIGFAFRCLRHRRKAQAHKQGSILPEGVETGSGVAPPTTSDDKELSGYQRRGAEVILACPDPNRELVREQQANMIRKYDPTTLTYTSANASSTATINYMASGPGVGAPLAPVQLDPFQDPLTTQVPAAESSSSPRLEGGRLLRPSSVANGQAPRRNLHNEIDEERDILQIQIMMLQRQLDEVREANASMTPDLPPAYEGLSEIVNSSTT